MYIREMRYSFIFPKRVGKILKWYGFDPVYRGNKQYVFLKKDFNAIKLPFYMRLLIKYSESNPEMGVR